ncbi:hypothetical protein NUSPORA_01496 [Nucleospora cyclopteri]
MPPGCSMYLISSLFEKKRTIFLERKYNKKSLKHEKSRRILYNVKQSETLSSNKEARKVFLELIFKCNPANIQKAIATLEKRIKVHKRELEVHQSRDEFSLEEQCN